MGAKGSDEDYCEELQQPEGEVTLDVCQSSRTCPLPKQAGGPATGPPATDPPCCCCCCFLTLTDPLRIQPWSQDRRNQTKSNRESEMSMESIQKRTGKK